MYDNKSEYEIGMDKLFTNHYKYNIGIDVVNKNYINSKVRNQTVLIMLFK